MSKGNKARVTKTFLDGDRGTVDILFDIYGFGDAPVKKKERHFLQRKDGSDNEVGIRILRAQLGSVGLTSKSKAEIAANVPKLDGVYVILDITNQKNSDYQKFSITGPGQRDVEVIINEPGDDDEELPF